MFASAITLSSAARTAISRLADALELAPFQPGQVWLAGAGPGDPGLITVLGLHAIASADVIFHDALVNPTLLRFARPGAEIVDSGKRRGQASARQADISYALVARARRRQRVLRLKGGDPFVFGRGGEEALALARAGIAFRIIPGVTAGIGGLAYAGIPVTHRETNHVVTFLTGHGADGRLPDVDWRAIAQGSPTIVLYMALAHAGEIAAKLMHAGRASDELAAIVSDATYGRQNVAVTTLAGLGDAARACKAPAVLVIGENVRLREGLDWIGALSGRMLDPDPLKRSRLSNAS
jgi:uroporphyrin-III C-methyltransferase